MLKEIQYPQPLTERVLVETHSIRFRDYSPADLVSCGNLAREAWPLPPGIAVGVRTGDMLGSWISSTAASSTWTEVAEDEHEVIGMLFGKVEGQPVIEKHRTPIRIQLRMLLRVMSGSYGNIIGSIRLMIGFLTTEVKLLLYDPKTDAEIVMLVVGEAHRGKGIGKELVDRFIEVARKQGARSLSLYTDDQTSNWKFYEALGFKQVAKFYDNGSSRYSGKRANGLIYRIDI
jgi:ribosomal protein S18 acetylase RimI-like enzyme